MGFLGKLLIGAAATYVVILGVLYFGQRRLMYFPTNENPQPGETGLTGVIAELITTPDGERLVAWYTPAAHDRPTVLFFHGNGGEIGSRADRFFAYQSAGFGVMFVSWRGYGGSTGSPSEAGIITDATTAYTWLIENGVAPEKIAVVGESLGTGAAVQLAAANQVGALVLVAPYSSTVEIAARQYPFVPVRWLMKDQFRSIDHIARVSAPILIIHGTADRVIPFVSGKRLFDAATAPKELVALENEGHGAIFSKSVVVREIGFINSTLAGLRPP